MPNATRDQLRRYAPLYLGLYGLGASALLALTNSVNAPAYAWLVHGAFLVGCLLSFRGSRHGKLYLLPGVLFMVLGFTAYGLRARGPAVFGLLYPPEVLAQDDLALAALVGWFLVAFSFWQGSRPNLVFCVVCSLALFGLVGTLNLSLSTWLWFCVFILCTAFCWGYEQFLELDDALAERGPGRRPEWRDMVRGHLAVATLLAVITLGASQLLGSGIYQVTPNIYSRMAERAYGWEMARRLTMTYSTFEEEFRLGTGPVELSPVPVMRVRAERAALWRGAVYDYYDGHGWGRTQRHRTDLLADPTAAPPTRYLVPPRVLYDQRRGTVLRQRFEPLGHTGRLLAAAQPEAVDLPQAAAPPPRRSTPHRPEGMWLPWGRPRSSGPEVDAYGCMSWEGGSRHQLTSYDVLSREPLTDPAVLRAARDDYSAFAPDAYLQVPAATVLALKTLVADVVADQPTAYDRMLALKHYLEERCIYSLKAPAVPFRQDVVAHFVLRSRRGACDQFATALVIMCRMAGIPARLATGYATGEYDAALGAFLVRGTDAHAWAEVAFPGVGWVPVDAQARIHEDRMRWTDLLTMQNWDLAARQGLRVAGWALLAIVVLGLAASAVVDPAAALAVVRRRRARSELEQLTREYRGFYLWLLRRQGLRVPEGMTPQEAVALACGQISSSVRQARLGHLNDGFYRLRYGATADPTAVQRVRGELRRLRKDMGKRR